MNFVKIKGKFIPYTFRRKVKEVNVRNDGACLYLGKSKVTKWGDRIKIRETSDHYFIRTSARPTEEDIIERRNAKHQREIKVQFDKLDHLLESAIGLQKKLKSEQQTDSDFYFALFRLIEESKKERKRIINESKEVYDFSRPK